MALFFYHVVFGVRYLGILNGVAAFVIIGIGKLLKALFSTYLILLWREVLCYSPICSKDMKLTLVNLPS